MPPVWKRLVLGNAESRMAAGRYCREAPDGYVMRIAPPAKSRDQEEKYHAMIGDIAAQCLFMGKKWEREDWKRLLVDAFAKAMRDANTPIKHEGHVVPSLDGERVVQLGIQTRQFSVREACEFVEYLYAYGSEQGVVWTDPKQQRVA